jgi:hypothetical protein
MTVTEQRPAVVPSHAGPAGLQLPVADDRPTRFAGFTFEGGDAPPHAPGLFVLARRVGAVAFPVFIGESQDLADAVQDWRTLNPSGEADIDGVFWVGLFRQTAHAVLKPPAAEVAIAKVDHMATCFLAGFFLSKPPA